MNDCANMARRYEREIPKGYEARIEGNKVIIELIEPKETEDERIRKEIIEYLTVTREKDLVGHPERRRWITYLEKQKSISDSLKAAGIDVYQDGSIERHTVPYLEKQKEQKPVDVSEKIEELCSKYPLNKDVMSEEELSAYHQGLSFGATTIAEYLEQQKGQKDYRKLYEDIANSEWYKNAYVGKSLGEEDEQKPAVYKDQKSLFEKFNSLVYDCAWGKVTCELEGETKEEYAKRWAIQLLSEVQDWADDYIDYECASRLRKSYEKEHQPAEWSEEDCKIIESINTVFDMCAEKNIATEETTLYKLRAWLKSLRERINILPRQEWSEDYCDEDLRTRFAFYTYKDEDNVLYLSNVFVEETSRNKGFGTKILAAAEKVAETIGATNIRLKVKQDSLANAWYRKHGYSHMSVEDGYDWLEKTLEYLKPIKSEWSEEDEKMRNKIIGHLSAYIYPNSLYGEDVKECIDWFESLCPQPKQEWSEEDKRVCDGIIAILEAWDRSHTVSVGIQSMVPKYCLWLETRLKSLCPQPHWKPSEDQMKALENAYTGHGPVYRKAIQCLYEDLQKLTNSKD